MYLYKYVFIEVLSCVFISLWIFDRDSFSYFFHFILEAIFYILFD